METKKGDVCKLYVDGAARGNPGPSGAGVYLFKGDEVFCKKGFFIDRHTNNEAEYIALLIGLFYCDSYMEEGDSLIVYSDSQLIVRHLLGIYRVKKPELKYFFSIAQSVLSKFSCSIVHVTRDKNKVADAMANKGIDEKIKISSGFESFLKKYETL